MSRRFGTRTAYDTGTMEYRRLASMAMLLILVGVMMFQSRRPENWIWLVSDKSEPVASGQASGGPTPPPPVAESVEAGPTDLDEQERTAARKTFEIITDKSPLAPEEMFSYWRFMAWSRRQSFEQMEKRARNDVFFVHLWDQPEKYRGELIELRVKLRRILSHDAPENSAGVKTVYEAWGTTDDSKSYPYVLVFSELPPGMAMGSRVEEEGIFIGYFLKTMSFMAFNARRAAPLLIGKLRRTTQPSPLAARQGGPRWKEVAIVGGIAAAIVLWTLVLPRLRRKKRPVRLSKPLPVTGDPPEEIEPQEG